MLLLSASVNVERGFRLACSLFCILPVADSTSGIIQGVLSYDCTSGIIQGVLSYDSTSGIIEGVLSYDSTSCIIQAVLSCHILTSFSLKRSYLWSFSVMVLRRLWLLRIATSTECPTLDGFIMHNCVRSIVLGSPIGYSGPVTVELVTGVL